MQGNPLTDKIMKEISNHIRKDSYGQKKKKGSTVYHYNRTYEKVDTFLRENGVLAVKNFCSQMIIKEITNKVHFEREKQILNAKIANGRINLLKQIDAFIDDIIEPKDYEPISLSDIIMGNSSK